MYIPPQIATKYVQLLRRKKCEKMNLSEQRERGLSKNLFYTVYK
jgi:hypothetical protein